WSIFWPLLIDMPRILAALIVAPLFPPGIFPTLLRSAIVVSLSLGLYPHFAAMAPVTLAPLAWLALLGKEILLGALIGVAVGVLIWVFESVGALIDVQVGLSNGLLFDPFGGHQGGPTAAFMAQLAVILFVAGGGLYVLVSLLYESFRIWPVASFYPTLTLGIADFGTAQMGSLAQLLVRLAAPVILLLLLVDFGFGLLNRVVPQLNVFFFTMPIKGVLAALMIAVYLSYLVDVAGGELGRLETLLGRLAPALAGIDRAGEPAAPPLAP
ncbi:MAG: type III secretion system export apparatus subunit SctT, partial [Steroidobacteraceae bacterium]